MQKLRTLFIFLLLISSLLKAQSPPEQALSGPGGSDYAHSDVLYSDYNDGPSGFFLFQPIDPMPDSADLVIFTHGNSQVNPKVHGGWIRHLVQKGNIVVYPKYQEADGSTAVDDFTPNTVTAILNAIDTLGLPGFVKPRLEHMAMIGHSYGGIISANLALQQEQYGLPEFRTLLVCQGYYGNDIALPSYSGFPSDFHILTINGEDDSFVDETLARTIFDSSGVSTEHMNFIRHYADGHGSPGLSAGHQDPVSMDLAFDSGESNLWVAGAEFLASTNAVDYYCYWKLSDALLACSFYGEDCNVAFGDTPAQRSMGQWSDGTPVLELYVEPQSATSSKEIGLQENLEVYPNPCQGMLQVHSDSRGTLRIYDLYGRLFFEKPLKAGAQTLDLRQFLPERGYYLLEIKGERHPLIYWPE